MLLHREGILSGRCLHDDGLYKDLVRLIIDESRLFDQHHICSVEDRVDRLIWVDMSALDKRLCVLFGSS